MRASVLRRSIRMGARGDYLPPMTPRTSFGKKLTFELAPGSLATPVKPIAALTGGTQDASPMFAGPSARSLFFADDAVGGTGRVRWMQLAWP